MLHRNEATPLQPHSSDYDLANEFSNFFKGKIQSTQSGGTNSRWQDQPKYTTKLTESKPSSEEEVMEIVTKSPNKYCKLDPIPTNLIEKECIDVLPLLIRIINISLQIGGMPKVLKKAIITPLIKKLCIELINTIYRSVSNLAFLSKHIERTVAIQLMNHLIENNLTDTFQFAYRKGYGTETALLKVQNDILMEMDKENAVLHALLDLSAAFDTIDHDILPKRLSTRYCIEGIALNWFHSYLSNRTQTVIIASSESTLEPLKYGVPQGSILGSILFSIYNSTIGEIIKNTI